MPDCPHCKKNDMVFASAMFGKKDVACVRCKRTFRPMRKKKETGTKTMIISRRQFAKLKKAQVNRLLQSGYSITVTKK